MPPNSFNIQECTEFSFDSWSYDSSAACLSLHYSINSKYKFCEKFFFADNALPIPSNFESAFNAACELLHLVAGVSYYKTTLPKTISLKSQVLDQQQSSFLNKLYKNGLGEFSYKNSVSLEHINFPCSAASKPIQEKASKLPENIVVPFGGGKDSIVTAELLTENNIPFSTFVLGDFALLKPILKLVAKPCILVKRVIDPLLFEINRLGAYNGHVPISSIIAATLPVAGILHGFNTAILSNEASANIPNLFHNGQAINHQYSKSIEFETDIRDYLNTFIPFDFNYFSLLRPLSELAIAKLFARNVKYDQYFSSCNSNFTLTKTSISRWCLKCPKCYSTFICLAPFCSKERLNNIFGTNLLDNVDGLPILEELVGTKNFKPFECVIDTTEARAALEFLSKSADWNQSALVKWYVSQNLEAKADLASFFMPSSSHFIPSQFRDLLNVN